MAVAIQHDIGVLGGFAETIVRLAAAGEEGNILAMSLQARMSVTDLGTADRLIDKLGSFDETTAQKIAFATSAGKAFLKILNVPDVEPDVLVPAVEEAIAIAAARFVRRAKDVDEALAPYSAIAARAWLPESQLQRAAG